MKLEQLRYLVALDKCHSMNQASRQLYISQQAISAAIKALEEELHTTLVTRTNKGTYLTEAGQKVADLASAFFDSWAQVQQEFDDAYYHHHPKTLTIGSCDNVIYWFMPSFLSSFYKHYPQVSLKLIKAADLAALYTQLRSGETDFALAIVDDLSRVPAEFHYHEIDTLMVGCLVNKQSPLAQLKKISLAQAMDYPIMTAYQLSDANNLVANVLKKYDVLDKAHFIPINDLYLMKTYLHQNLSIALDFIPEHIVQCRENRHENLQLIPLHEKYTISFGYLTLKAQDPKQIKELLQTVEHVFFNRA